MKKLFRISFTILLAAILFVCQSANALALSGDGLYIATREVPQDIVQDAWEHFSVLYPSLSGLGITNEDAERVALSQGFMAFSYPDSNASDYIYYFLVFEDDEIASLFTVFYAQTDGELHHQFGATKMSDALNNLETSEDTPATIYAAGESMFAIVGTEVIVLSKGYDISDEEFAQTEQELLDMAQSSTYEKAPMIAVISPSTSTEIPEENFNVTIISPTEAARSAAISDIF